MKTTTRNLSSECLASGPTMNRLTHRGRLAACVLSTVAVTLVAGDAVTQNSPALKVAGADMVAGAAPEGLAQAIRRGLPVAVALDGRPLAFQQKKPGLLENVTGDLITQLVYAREEAYNALWYQVRFTNQGDKPIGKLAVKPFVVRIAVDPPRAIPRVRYLTGSQHYDATYPSRAFELVDRAIMIPDHAKPIEIGGSLSKEYVEMMQFALQRGREMAGVLGRLRVERRLVHEGRLHCGQL